MPCFIAGQMKALTYNQYILYSQAENTFLRIRAYDLDVKAKRVAGNTQLSYYNFKEGERSLYILGQRILIQNDATNSAIYQDVIKV